MKFLRVFGIGKNSILAKNHFVSAVVTDVDKSYLYVVKKPLRFEMHYRPGNSLTPNDTPTALYSHYIHFTYTVDNIPYTGKLFVNVHTRCPQKGETICVYYDPEKPENYACYAFGPAVRPIGW